LRFHPNDRSMLWDCDDVAIFDVPGTRIALAYTERPRAGVAASLLIAVGPSPKPVQSRITPTRAHASVRHDVLCSRLVERVQSRLSPQAVHWHESASQLTTDLIDALSSVQSKTKHRVMPKRPAAEAAKAEALAKSFASANDVPDLPAPRDIELIRLREALYPVGEALPQPLASNQLRLAAHTMNATLIMVSLPLGAALTTYAILRGENMRMTTAAMVFSGLAGTMLQTGIGHHLMTIASI
jgi:hypothetical protein